MLFIGYPYKRAVYFIGPQVKMNRNFIVFIMFVNAFFIAEAAISKLPLDSYFTFQKMI